MQRAGRGLLSEKQRVDFSIKPIIDYLQDGLLPPNDDQARRHLFSQEHYAIMEGVLYHLHMDNGRCALSLTLGVLFLQQETIINCLMKFMVESYVVTSVKLRYSVRLGSTIGGRQ